VLSVGRALASAAIVSAVAGCGAGTRERASPVNDRGQIVGVLKSLAQAINGGDVTRLCKHVYAFQGSTTTHQCENVLTRSLANRSAHVTIRPSVVRVRGSRATVVAITTGLSRRTGRQPHTYSLVKERGSWRVLFD
jgi:hypothetical protein